jgi:hypothetical protein
MDQEAIADLHNELRLLLNAWDPLGVADLVADEYDGLAGRVLGRLAQGATTAEMGEFLWFEMEEPFGIDPSGCEADEMGARLAAWYAAKQGPGT